MLNSLPLMMARCLILTLLIEGFSAFIIGIREKKDLLNVALVNCMTNPIVVVSTVLVGLFFGREVRIPVEIIEEISVVIIEGFVYYKVLRFRKINPFLVSLILNGISYGSGFIVNAILY